MTTFAPIHSSELNKISFLGVDLSSGLAEDTYLEMTPSGPLTFAGTDAGSSEEYISVNSDRSGTVVLTLNAQSASNLKLLGMVKEARRDGGRPLIGDFYIERNGTLFLYQPLGCHIMERPAHSVGKDMTTTTNTWTFRCANLNEIDVDDYQIDVDLKASIKGEISGSIELSITL